MNKLASLDGFTPTPDRQREFRDVLGCFGTGVTVVTCQTSKGPMGITANSFSAVSLDPPLVLWCPAHSSHRYPLFSEAQHYAIHVLSSDQLDLASAFARDGFAFDQCAWTENAHGVPVLTDTLARFECEAYDLHQAGDHAIAVGRVLRAHAASGSPLLFTQGGYGQFTPFD